MAAKKTRILLVTPEIARLPKAMGKVAGCISTGSSSLGNYASAVTKHLIEQNLDVHVALPNYRTIIYRRLPNRLQCESFKLKKELLAAHIHFAEDREFYYLTDICCHHCNNCLKLSVVFQRDVIQRIIPMVNPDLIHCIDWMTGLIPAMARHCNIPCRFTVFRLQTVKTTLAYIEDQGIDAASFWEHLYYDHWPLNYEETRTTNSTDLLADGIHAANYVDFARVDSADNYDPANSGFLNSFIQHKPADKQNTDRTYTQWFQK